MYFPEDSLFRDGYSLHFQRRFSQINSYFYVNKNNKGIVNVNEKYKYYALANNGNTNENVM